MLNVKNLRGAAKEAQRIELVDIICDAFELPKGSAIPAAVASPSPPRKNSDDDDHHHHDGKDDQSPPPPTDKNVFAAVSDILEASGNSDEAMVMLQMLRYRSNSSLDSQERQRQAAAAPSAKSIAADLQRMISELEQDDQDDDEEEDDAEDEQQEEGATAAGEDDNSLLRRKEQELEHRRRVEAVMDKYSADKAIREATMEEDMAAPAEGKAAPAAVIPMPPPRK